jgi:RNA polymerase sigma factor (sigma-70 family)
MTCDERAPAAGPPRPDHGFPAFFEKEVKNVIRFLLATRGGCLEDARDAAQEAMVEVLRRWAGIERPEQYVRRVAMQKWNTAWTQRDRRQAAEAEAQAARQGPASTTIGTSYRQLHAAIEKLPEQQRKAIVLELDGRTRTEIAATLGITEVTVRSHLRYARDKLGLLLADLPMGEPR